MRCPSTSDLVHMQANHAYDKLAVISDNIEALQAIYDFIFDIKEYLHQRLKEYMHKHRDELIDGQKTFTKPIRLEELELFSSVNADIEDTIGRIKLDFTTCAPYISFKVSRTDDETKEEYSSEVKLILDTCNGEPLLTIPPTNGEVDESSVRVDFLNEQLSSIKDRLLSLEDRATQLEQDVTTIQGRLDNALDYPESGSNALVTSDGIYTYGQNIINALTGNVDAAIAGVTDANTTYSFSLSGNTLIITPSSGDAQTVDLSSLVSSGNSNNDSNYSGSSETEGTYAGWRIWTNGKLAAIHIPAGAITAYNQQTASVELPFQVDSIIYHNHPSTGTGGNSTWTLSIDTDGNYIDLTYTGGGLSPGQGINYAFDIICWLK